MNHDHSRRRRRVGLALTALLAGGAIAVTPALGATQNLVGTFKITKGTYAKGKAKGSYFRMVYPNGTVTGGPFFANPDSSSSDKTFTLVSPGTAGGLVTGAYQPPPSPAFDAKGNSRARAIIAPTGFSGIKFGLVTTSKDATGKATPAPRITAKNGVLSGDLRAFTANWNKLAFNQGSPKPDGSRPPRPLRSRGPTTPQPVHSRSRGPAPSSAARSTASPARGIWRGSSRPRNSGAADRGPRFRGPARFRPRPAGGAGIAWGRLGWVVVREGARGKPVEIRRGTATVTGSGTAGREASHWG